MPKKSIGLSKVDKVVCKEVLSNYPMVDQAIELRRLELQSRGSRDNSNAKSHSISDSTATLACRYEVDKKLKRLENEKKAVKKVLSKCNLLQKKLLEMKYFCRKRLFSDEVIAYRLHISIRFFYQLQYQILVSLAEELGRI